MVAFVFLNMAAKKDDIVLAPTKSKRNEDSTSNLIRNSQCAEWILNKIAKYINKTFTGLKCMLQGFRICFV